MTAPTDEAIAQAFRERLESMYSPLTVREVMKAVEARARELDAEKGGEHSASAASDEAATKAVFLPCDCGCGRSCCAMCGNDVGFIATPPESGGQGKIIGWCKLTPNGSIAHFDGKPMFMAGPFGNYMHPTPVYAHQKKK